jgi:hypothetical protein
VAGSGDRPYESTSIGGGYLGSSEARPVPVALGKLEGESYPDALGVMGEAMLIMAGVWDEWSSVMDAE